MSDKLKRLHLISNAHIDPVWLWNKPEGMGAAISTFRTAVRFCRDCDGYVFNHNEAVLYQYVEDYDPELFAQIKKYVAEGKWHIMGGWYLQPDCNMPCGESFVRQIDLGQTYFREKLGYEGFKTAVNLDPFGHSVGLVQILNKAGYDSYLCIRPHKFFNDEREFNNKVFDWAGLCGSRVTVFKARCYNSNLGKSVNTIRGFAEDQKDKAVGAALWGVGDHGGGPSEIDLKQIGEFAEQAGYDVIHSTPEAFFEDYLKNEKPEFTLNGSMKKFSVGCYTSMVRIKQDHRKLENSLLMAEKAASTTAANGICPTFPSQQLTEAWQDLAFSQFHDSLPGSSIQQVENDILQTIGHGYENSQKVLMKAFFQSCGGQTPAQQGDQPVLVYNPHPYELETDVECEYMMEDQRRVPNQYTVGDVYDESGKKIPCQNEKENSNLPIDWAKKVVFTAKLAPLGVTRFNIKNRIDTCDFREPLKAENGYFYFDNGVMSAKINEKTGLLDSYKVGGREFVKPGAAKLLVIADSVDPWEMSTVRFNEVIGEFKAADPETAARVCGITGKQLAPVRVIENGEVRTVIEAVFTYNDSALCLHYTLPKVGTDIKLNLRVFSMERTVMLKLSVPTVISGGKYTGKVAFGRETLDTDSSECVAQGWTMLSDGENAVGIVNTGSYGSDCDGSEIRMSVLRTPGYSAHPIDDRQILPEDRFSPRIDIGERLFDYVLCAGRADEISERIDSVSAVANQKPIALSYSPSSEGKKPLPFCLVPNTGLELVTVKPAKDGNGYILRLHNTYERSVSAEISFPIYKTAYTVKAEAFEIITLRLDGKGRAAAAGLLD